MRRYLHLWQLIDLFRNENVFCLPSVMSFVPVSIQLRHGTDMLRKKKKKLTTGNEFIFIIFARVCL